MISYHKMDKINPLSLIIEKRVWEKFKKIVPRDKNLNDAVVDLIKKEISYKIKMDKGSANLTFSQKEFEEFKKDMQKIKEVIFGGKKKGS